MATRPRNQKPAGGGGGEGGDGGDPFTTPAIEAKYQDLGGSSGFLGKPIGQEQWCTDRVGRLHNYQHGSIYWHPGVGAFEVHGLIRQKWLETDSTHGPLRYPTADEQPDGSADGRLGAFQGGAIDWSPAGGAHVLFPPILDRWKALGGAAGFLGRARTDDASTPGGRGRYAHFEGGSIYWTPEYGAFEVHGLIRARWAELSWEQGFLGFPVSDETALPDGTGRFNVFEHGVITWGMGDEKAAEGPHHYERIYAAVRAQLFARFFALGVGGRRNQLALQNLLPDRVSAGTVQPSDRWDIQQSNGENPFLYGALAYAMLAVEHQAGNAESTRALRAGLATIGSLYRWSRPGSPSSRLPVRWDPGIPTGARNASDQFLEDRQGQYATEIAPTDLGHFSRRDAGVMKRLLGTTGADGYQADQADYAGRFRPWELSEDEVTGLVTIYSLAHALAGDDAEVAAAVKRQAGHLGNYLAEHGYLLVRPHGGLSYRGASGILPALEHPISRVLGPISGFDVASAASFQEAMDAAWYWRCLSGPVSTGRTLASIGAVAFLVFSPVAALLGLALGSLEELIGGQLISPGTLGAAAAVAANTGCFDVENSELNAPAAAVIFMEAPDKRGFYKALALAQASFAKYNSWSVNFHAWYGLTGLDDADGQVRDTFSGWFRNRQQHPELEVKGRGAKGIFAAGVAALVNADAASEGLLLARLDQAVVELFRSSYFDPQLPIAPDDAGHPCECILFPHASDAQPYEPLDLCAGLALAFWHARRQRDAGVAIDTPRFPSPLSAAGFAAWPPIAVPVDCLETLTGAGIPAAALQGTATPAAVNGGYALYLDPPVPRNPVPVLPVASEFRLRVDQSVSIGAKDPGDVDTGIVLTPGEELQIDASGDISPGGLFAGRNGPEGTNDIVDDTSWPMHSAIADVTAVKYCLLGRLDGYFVIGAGLFRTRFSAPGPRRLFLRINDDNPGDGDGTFTARIRVWTPT